ncbi:MAG TPA: RlmE family RNA methyltransferase [Anaeromyxobacter sp.]|nr:RlmE family RNA methyltransferase [Anaeromyxobacter sp.]
MAKPYDPKDFYFRKAKKQGLRARSAFKIEEILRRHRLLGRGDAVLDLGAAPGGFLQILAEEVGEGGVAVGVDLEPIRNLGKRWVKTAVVDLLAPDAIDRIRALHGGTFRLVTSDMAPKTIGVKVTDEARSLELVRMALRVAEETLARGGAFVAKVFMGGDFPALKKEFAERFAEVHVVRPEATREHSFEVYLLGKVFRGRKPAPTPAPAPEPEPELVRPSSPRPPKAAATLRTSGSKRGRPRPAVAGTSGNKPRRGRTKA